MTEIAIHLMRAFMLLMLAPLLSGVIKTLKARLQNRRGPSILQPYYDVIKLLRKDQVVSPTTSWVFRLAPFIYLAVTLAAAAMIPLPLFADGGYFDLFLLIYLLAVGRFCLVLASLDAGSAFGGMGGSREMYLSTLVEPVLLLALLTIATRSGSTGLLAMARTASSTPFTLPYLFAAGAFFIVAIAETGRVPVDNPDTHLELTMVHEGMVLEYSGRYLGLIHLAAALKQLIILLLFAIYFLPWHMPGGAGLASLELAAKLAVTAAALAMAETSTNKMRLFRIPGFLAVSGLLSVLALVAQ